MYSCALRSGRAQTQAPGFDVLAQIPAIGAQGETSIQGYQSGLWLGAVRCSANLLVYATAVVMRASVPTPRWLSLRPPCARAFEGVCVPQCSATASIRPASSRTRNTSTIAAMYTALASAVQTDLPFVAVIASQSKAG